jgi:hypothetical protein
MVPRRATRSSETNPSSQGCRVTSAGTGRIVAGSAGPHPPAPSPCSWRGGDVVGSWESCLLGRIWCTASLPHPLPLLPQREKGVVPTLGRFSVFMERGRRWVVGAWLALGARVLPHPLPFSRNGRREWFPLLGIGEFGYVVVTGASSRVVRVFARVERWGARCWRQISAGRICVRRW